jgi:peptidoglycan/LPS O-acetylase OafA/YrhL
MSPNNKHTFAALDGLRGIAAICVVVFHFSQQSVYFSYSPTEFIPSTYLAVDFFFMLSGFVIAHAYGERLSHGMSFLEFLEVRLIRLYPLYILSLVIALAVVFLGSFSNVAHYSRIEAIESFTLSTIFFPTPASVLNAKGLVFPLNSPAWSLSLEIAINIAYAFCYRWLTTGRTVILVILSAMLLIGMALHDGSPEGGVAWGNYLIGWPRVVALFLIGTLLFRLFQNSRAKASMPSWLGYGLGLTLVMMFMLPKNDVVSGVAASLLVCPAIVYFGALVRSPIGPAGKLFSWGGTLSYAIYVLHVPIFDFLKVIYRYAGLGELETFRVLNGFIWISLAFGAAVFLHYCYDLPVRRLLRRLSRSAKTEMAPQTLAADLFAIGLRAIGVIRQKDVSTDSAIATLLEQAEFMKGRIGEPERAQVATVPPTAHASAPEAIDAVETPPAVRKAS